MDRAYRASTRLIGAVTAVIGLALIMVTLARGGGPLAVGVVAGVLFTVLGIVRFRYASRHDA